MCRNFFDLPPTKMVKKAGLSMLFSDPLVFIFKLFVALVESTKLNVYFALLFDDRFFVFCFGSGFWAAIARHSSRVSNAGSIVLGIL